MSSVFSVSLTKQVTKASHQNKLFFSQTPRALRSLWFNLFLRNPYRVRQKRHALHLQGLQAEKLIQRAEF